MHQVIKTALTNHYYQPNTVLSRVRKHFQPLLLASHVHLNVRLAPTGQIFVEFDIWGFFEKSVENIKFWQQFGKNNRYFFYMKTNIHFFITSRSVLLRMRNVSGKFVQKIKTHVSYSLTLFRNSFRFWDNAIKFGRGGQAIGGNILWRWSFVCWINKAIDTHSVFVILTAFFFQG